jgi:hypothetical protein
VEDESLMIPRPACDKGVTGFSHSLDLVMITLVQFQFNLKGYVRKDKVQRY